MNIVLTGATGFVGAALLSQLALLCVAGRSIKVHALIRDPERFDAPGFVRVLKGDVNNIPEGLFFDESHVLVHFGVKQIDTDGSGFHKDNVEGTSNLLSHCNVSTLGVVYGSTLSVLGQKAQSHVDETLPLDPQTPLAESRAAAETLIINEMKDKGRWAYCLRPRFIFDVNDKFVLPGIKGLAEKGLCIGNGRQRYSIIAASDYADVIVSLIDYIEKNNASGEIHQKPLNVGYQEAISFEIIFSQFRQEMSCSSSIKKIPMPQWLPSLLKKLNKTSITAKAVQLELIGFDHFGDVSALENVIGSAIVRKNSAQIVSQMIKEIAHE